MYGLKPVPFIQSSFSAACKAQLSFQPFAAPFDSAQGRLEAGPCLQSNKFQRLQTSMQATNDGMQLPFSGLTQLRENEQRPGPEGHVNLTFFRGLKPPAPSVIINLQL